MKKIYCKRACFDLKQHLHVLHTGTVVVYTKIFLFLQIKLFYVKTLYVCVAVGCTNAFNLSGIKNLIYVIQLGVIIIMMKHFNVHVVDVFS